MPYNFHPDLRTPLGRTVLWRYMDFAKFVETLESRTLWFARLDQLDDPLEGTHTDAELKGLRKHLEQKRAEQLISLFRAARSETFVNCWRSGLNESLAMADHTGLMKYRGLISLLWDMFCAGISNILKLNPWVLTARNAVQKHAVYFEELQ